MPRKRRDAVEQAIEDALSIGSSVGRRESWGFVEDVERAREQIAPLIGAGDAERAVALLELFIAGCYDKAEEVHDSGGRFGQFVEDLYCDWIRARQAAGADPDETAVMLLSCMENDEYGFGHDLDRAAVEVLDREGLAAFERAVRDWDAHARREPYAARRKVGILKRIHEKRRDVDAYAALCEEDGLSPRDCERLAGMCLRKRRPEDALAWVDRGLELDEESRWPGRSAWNLLNLRRDALRKLGRGAEALQSAWEEFRQAPSVHRYETLMRLVPKNERTEWGAKALSALDRADLSDRIELLVKTKEGERLARAVKAAPRAKLVALRHSTTERAAKALARTHPPLAAKLHVAMALHVVEAGKSKDYGAALRNLETARKILLREGRAKEWSALADEIRVAHRRKNSFIHRFESLEQRGPTTEPSFRDRARARWARTAGRRRGA